LAQAIAFNLLFVLSLPIAAWYGVRLGAAVLTGRGVNFGAWTLRLFIVWFMVAILFGVARNIDVWPCLLLAPHRL
jgi:hypothetical protein